MYLLHLSLQAVCPGASVIKKKGHQLIILAKCLHFTYVHDELQKQGLIKYNLEGIKTR